MVLCKTLNSRMNIIETRAVLNIVQTDGKLNLNEIVDINGKQFNFSFTMKT